MDINVSPEKKGRSTSDKQIVENLSFMQVFCNGFKFYGRIMGVCFSHNPKLGRGTKSLNWATQVILMATIVSLLSLFSDDDWDLTGG